MSKQQIGVVGMAVMGRNLALNIESRGYTVSIFNRSRDKTEEVIAENPGKKLVPYYTVKEFVESLETPLDVVMNEDDCKLRRGNAAELFSGIKGISPLIF